MGAINRRTCPVFPGLVYRVQHRKRDKSRHKRRYKGNAAGGTDNPHIQTVQRRINRGGENKLFVVLVLLIIPFAILSELLKMNK